MKHIFTISLCFLALSLSAQTDGWEYPFPYNPDGNADGYIALDDLMDFLALYGQEYPDSFYSDTTRAVLNLGEMGALNCHSSAEAAGKEWRVMSVNDIAHVTPLLTNFFASSWNDFWFDSPNQQFSRIYFVVDNNTSDSGLDYVIDSEGDRFKTYLETYSSSSINLSYKYNCVLVSEVHREVEYHIVSGGQESVSSAVSDSLSNGWKLSGGISAYSSGNHKQAIWRWAE